MEYFEKRYKLTNAGQGMRILAMAAAHHRLNYIHPFPDGNGRVSRLMSHAMARQAGIGAHGLWSISRGLARGLGNREEYKMYMDHADMPRQGDLDGRGNLSLKALVTFTDWFLKVCLDQIRFMGSLFDFATLEKRLADYVAHQGLRPEANDILHHLLLRGEMPRGDAPRVSGLKERTARQLMSELVANGIVRSDTPKSELYLNFTVQAVEVLFPALFPV
jgi:Fic family protein